MLSRRLKSVAEMVKKCNVTADIGTDHGYIPIYLIKNKITDKAIAADVSKGSCDKAYHNIFNEQLDEKINVRCGNGLKVIKENEKVDCIIAAGMGGMLIINVLKSNEQAVQTASQLVLQPQRDINTVREYIHSIGFKITDEDMLEENGKYYCIISAEKGEEAYSKSEYYFGKILMERKSPVLRKYVQIELYKTKNVLSNLKAKGKEKDAKYIELTELGKLYEEVLNCL